MSAGGVGVPFSGIFNYKKHNYSKDALKKKGQHKKQTATLICTT